ncbi:hypothetical protein GGR52DRAFT_567792 [Hypoxylon sp. FL1284]|nr:hypothetical protein GGR52DRAFT_567792 [Hypoxylon sp. FL1284]
MLTSSALATSCLSEMWVTGATNLVIGNPYDPLCAIFRAERSVTSTLSPAICPEGLVSACNASPARDASETVWACCPTGWRCDGGVFSCTSDVPEGVTNTYTVTDIDTFGNTVTRQLIATAGLDIHSIRVAFHSSDLVAGPSPTASSASATSEPPATSVPTTATSPSSAAAATAAAASWSGLSAGATAGIGIAVGISIFLLLSAIAWFRWRSYRKKQQLDGGGGQVVLPTSQVDVSYGQSYNQSYSQSRHPPADIYYNERALPQPPLNEMDGASGLYELGTGKAAARSIRPGRDEMGN